MAFLFQGKTEKEISTKCKLCFTEIKFVVTLADYENTTHFPLKKESIHGSPPHKLIVSFDKNLEIQEFNIEDIITRRII